MMRLILKSLRDSVSLMRKNKLLFILLFVLQIIFLVFIVYITYGFESKMYENQKAIDEYVGNLNLSEESIMSGVMQQKGFLGDDPNSISRNFIELEGNFRSYLFSLFVLLVFFTALSWGITSLFFEEEGRKNFLSFAKNFSRILAVAAFYLSMIFLLFYVLFDTAALKPALELKGIFTGIAAFLTLSYVLSYFMYISIPLLRTNGFENLVQKTLSIGIRKFRYVIITSLINLSVIITSAWLFAYFIIIESDLLVISVSFLLIVLGFVFGRIFKSSLIGKIDKDSVK